MVCGVAVTCGGDGDNGVKRLGKVWMQFAGLGKLDNGGVTSGCCP